MSEKHTITPKLTITAEECRQNALACADGVRDVNSPLSIADLAAMSTMWATIGQLCCALGDPDNPEPDNHEPKTYVDYNITDHNPGRCPKRHPTLGGRCTLPAGHEGGHDCAGFTRMGR